MSYTTRAQALSAAREQQNSSAPAVLRLTGLFDPGSFRQLDALSEGSGVITGCGTVEGCPVYAFSQDLTSSAGAVGALHSKKVQKVYELALKTGCPVVGIYDSHGARLEEGCEALNAYGEMLRCANNLSGVVPQLSLVLGVCAGSAAMLASSADFVIASREAQFYLAPGAGAGTMADAAAKAGDVHLLAETEADALAQARRLLTLLPQNNLAEAPRFEMGHPAADGSVLDALCEDLSAWNAASIAGALTDAGTFLELQRDFGAGAVTGLGSIAGTTAGLVLTCGTLTAGACAKLARFVSVCDCYQIPVVTLVHASGFAPDALRASAKVAHVYAEATTPKIAVLPGEAIGSAYVALASRGTGADLVYAWPSAVISPLAPETAVAVLYGDRITAEKSRAQVEREYRENEASAFAAGRAGAIDEVIAPAETRGVLAAALDLLAGKRVTRLPKKHSTMPM